MNIIQKKILKNEKISGYSFDISGSAIYDDGYKWYECKNNMEAVSKFLPDDKIQVKGKGEEGEIWEIIFKDGDYHYNKNTSFLIMNLILRKKYI